MTDRKPVLCVTIENLETGDMELVILSAGEYVVVTAPPCHLAHTKEYGRGQTVQVIVKDRVP